MSKKENAEQVTTEVVQSQDANVVFQGKATGIKIADRAICNSEDTVTLPETIVNTVVNKGELGCYLQYTIAEATVPVKHVATHLAKMLSYKVDLSGVGSTVEGLQWNALLPSTTTRSTGIKMSKAEGDLVERILAKNKLSRSTATPEQVETALAKARELIANLDV
jgi:hypothetical protein